MIEVCDTANSQWGGSRDSFCRPSYRRGKSPPAAPQGQASNANPFKPPLRAPCAFLCSLYNVSCFAQYARPQENHDKDKAGKHDPAGSGCARIERLPPPIEKILHASPFVKSNSGGFIAAAYAPPLLSSDRQPDLCITFHRQQGKQRPPTYW